MVDKSTDESKEATTKRAAWEDTNTVFTNEKGGMVGYDKDQVKKIVYEMSKDSPHFKNEQRKQQQTQARIQRFKERAKHLSAQELLGHTRKMDSKISGLLATRDLSRTWIHVDLDAFFASVEELDDPSLKTKPMGVGGIGMLSTANYVARKYGIRAAMPGFIAKRLCPELVFVRPDFSKYSKASQEVRGILRDFDDNLEAGSLDEAYLDVTEYCQTHGITGPEVAAEMRAKVAASTGLTCSCGIAPNCMLAKICSDMNKPNGQFALAPDPAEINRFLDGLSIRKLPGIGKVGEQELNALGVKSCADLISQRGLLSALYSDIAVECFLEAGLGLGRTRHHAALKEGEVGRKGMSVERTFAPIQDTQELEAKCCELAAKLAEDLDSEGLRGKCLTLKLKPPTFEVKTRAVTLPTYISSEEEILTAALRLLRAEIPIQVRLMGLRMSNFYQINMAPGQQSLAAFFKPKPLGAEAEAPAEQLEREAERAQPAEAREADEAELQLEGRPSSSGILEDYKGFKKMWACQMCTFAENPRHSLRCLVCDQRRGSAPRAASTGSSGCEQPSPGDSCRKRKQTHVCSDPSEESTVCPKCGQALAAGSAAQEHADYHLAVDLDRYGSQGVAASGPQSKPAASSNARKPKQEGGVSITRFFKPNKAASSDC